MTIHEFYDQSIKSLPEGDKEELIGLLVSDLTPPPNSIRTREQLMDELRKGMASPVHAVTDQTWEYIESEIRRRHLSRRKDNA
jgi:hypothetical protein